MRLPLARRPQASARAPRQRIAVEDAGLAPPQLDQTALLRLPEHRIDGRARRAREARKLLLSQRDLDLGWVGTLARVELARGYPSRVGSW